MKITLIRTAKPVYAWKTEYGSEEFGRALAEYAAAPADGLSRRKMSTSGRPVYVGPERYCLETAEAMFDNLAAAVFLSTPVNAACPDRHQKNEAHEANEMEALSKKPLDSSYLSVQSPLYITALLRELPFDSSPYAGKTLSLSAWQRKAWLQRFFKGMFDKKSESRARAAELIAGIRAAGKNCIIIADEHMVNTLARELKRNGFHIKRGGLIHVDYLERIVATDNEPHCGGCMHDCPLSNPGCMIGKDKAAKLRSFKQIG